MSNFYVYCYLDTAALQQTTIEGRTFNHPPAFIGVAQHSVGKHAAVNTDAILPLLFNWKLYSKLALEARANRFPAPAIIAESLTEQQAQSVLTRLISRFGRLGLDDNGSLLNRSKPGAPEEKADPDDPLTLPLGHRSGLTKKGNPRKPGTRTEANAILLLKKKAFGTIPAGANHPAARTFILTSPAGQQWEVTGAIKDFVAEHNLCWELVCRWVNRGVVAPKPQRGWKPAYLNTIGWTIEKLPAEETRRREGNQKIIRELKSGPSSGDLE